MNKTAESFEETEVDTEVKAGLAENILLLKCAPPPQQASSLFCYLNVILPTWGRRSLGGGGLVEAEEAARPGLGLAICIRGHSR